MLGGVRRLLKALRLPQSLSQPAGRYPRAPYLDGSPHYHDGIVQGPFRLLHELLGASSQDYRARLGLRAAREEVIPAKGTTQQWLRQTKRAGLLLGTNTTQHEDGEALFIPE